MRNFAHYFSWEEPDTHIYYLHILEIWRLTASKYNFKIYACIDESCKKMIMRFDKKKIYNLTDSSPIMTRQEEWCVIYNTCIFELFDMANQQN